jgi:glycosyltransferase involved in cell wall biosynthesis
VKVLHLASWYPDRTDPYNGDFVQRHLKALSLFMPVTVIHMSQYGTGQELPESRCEENLIGELQEKICQFRFSRSGFPLYDRLRYNLVYYQNYHRLVSEYIKRDGRPDLVHVHVPMKAGAIALWMKRKFGIPFVVSEHSSAYYDWIPDNYFSRSPYYKHRVREIFSQAKAVSTVSQSVGDRLHEIFSLKKLSIIYNTVNTAYFSYQAPTSGPSRFRFIHASLMNHSKNVEGILMALSKLKTITTDWECLMLGWVNPSLRKICSDLQLDEHVEWEGVVSYESVAREMKRSSALVMFSRYENFPCVVLEALCCGLPVIATRVGGISEVIQDGNGILVESGNEEQLLQALRQMMEKYPGFDRQKMAEAAQSKFSYETIGAELKAFYQHSLAY